MGNDEMDVKQDLVSIIVVTYNSAKYVIETLNSCLIQTYKEIEIIISDDGSSDETLELCKNWQHNLNSKHDIQIITSNERRGIPANCNRGAKIAKGKWLKFLGADDLLEINAIDELMKSTIQSSNKVDFVFSRFTTFGEHIEVGEVCPYPFTWDLILKSENGWNKKLEWLFLLGFSNVAPGAFIRSAVYHELDGFDESYYLLEDLPLWYKLFTGKYHMGCCQSVTVSYRIHENQVTNNGISPLLKKDLLKFTKDKRRKYFIPYFHNRFQIFVLSNKYAKTFKFLNIAQLYISLYNRFHK